MWKGNVPLGGEGDLCRTVGLGVCVGEEEEGVSSGVVAAGSGAGVDDGIVMRNRRARKVVAVGWERMCLGAAATARKRVVGRSIVVVGCLSSAECEVARDRESATRDS